MTKVQTHVDKIINNYKKSFKEEYKNFIKQMKLERSYLKDDKGTVKGSKELKRVLFQYPETLDAMIQTGLDGKELFYFKSMRGARWFGKTYPEFKLIKKV